MLTVRSILCPVDFSEQSRQALLWASAIAQYRGGELTVLSVVEPLLAQAAGIRLGVDLAREEAEPALREFVEATLPERVRQASHVRMEVTVGDPSEAILQTGRRLKAGLIVMGTHGLGGFRKLLLGSTTEQVLRRTEWPVLAVPPGAVSAPAVEHPGVQLRKILLATDFRESAMSATQWAADLASDVAVPLVLAHVVEPVVVSPLWQALVADFEERARRIRTGECWRDCPPAFPIRTLSASYRLAVRPIPLRRWRSSTEQVLSSWAWQTPRTRNRANRARLRTAFYVSPMLRSLSCLALQRELRSIGPASGSGKGASR